MSERVTIRVDERTKERWRGAVEENPEYESMTHLIELAVYRELNDVGPTSNAGGESTVEYDPAVSNEELHEQTRRILNQLEKLNETAVTIEKDLPKSSLIEPVILEHLPESEENAVRPEVVASHTSQDEEHVARLLSKMADDMGRVKTTDRGTKYYADI